MSKLRLYGLSTTRQTTQGTKIKYLINKKEKCKKIKMPSMWATEESGSGTSAELMLGCNNVWTSLWAAASTGTGLHVVSGYDSVWWVWWSW